MAGSSGEGHGMGRITLGNYSHTSVGTLLIGLWLLLMLLAVVFRRRISRTLENAGYRVGRFRESGVVAWIYGVISIGEIILGLRVRHDATLICD